MSVLCKATYSAGKGIVKGVQAFASIDHFKDMATGALHMGLLCVDAMVLQDVQIYYAAISNVVLPELKAMQKLKEHNRLRTQAQIQAVGQAVCDMHEKLHVMSWQEVIENGAQLGTTMILDALTFHAIREFSRFASNASMNELIKAHESGALFTKEYAVEVAGFGKLIVEEGVEVTAKTDNIIKNGLISFAHVDKNISPMMKMI